MPYKTPTGKVYDSGDFAGTLARAQELADWDGFNKRAAQSKRAGRLRGIGIATYIEACGNNGPETATLTLDRDGGVTLLIGSQSTGQGHATSYAQLVAERLDLPPERVRVLQGDTDRIETGAGTGGSSSIPVGGVSVDRATKKLAEQIKEIAADALEAAASDLEIADGTVRVAGTDRVISFADLAAHPTPRPTSCARRTSSASSRRPIRTARTSPRSRSIRTPARRASCVTSSSMTSAPRLIRCCSPARCMAARCRASARR